VDESEPIPEYRIIEPKSSGKCGKIVKKGGFIATGPVKGHYADSRCTMEAGHWGSCR
jgi:hypothetical protein